MGEGTSPASTMWSRSAVGSGWGIAEINACVLRVGMARRGVDLPGVDRLDDFA